jgi:hypothetical protein
VVFGFIIYRDPIGTSHGGRAVADFRLVDPIGREAAGFDEPLKWVDHRQPVLLSQLHDQLSGLSDGAT